MALLKYSQIRQDLLCFVPRHTENPLITKFSDLKGADLFVDFGDAKLIRLSPMSDKKPKYDLKPALLGWFGFEYFGYLTGANHAEHNNGSRQYCD